MLLWEEVADATVARIQTDLCIGIFAEYGASSFVFVSLAKFRLWEAKMLPLRWPWYYASVVLCIYHAVQVVPTEIPAFVCEACDDLCKRPSHPSDVVLQLCESSFQHGSISDVYIPFVLVSRVWLHKCL